MNGQRTGQVQKLVQVDAADVEWVEEHYPHGFWSWFVRNSVKKFRALHEVTPAELVAEGVKALGNPPESTP
jgi:hypothetical protein